jgi:hypothetical protein
MPRRGKGSKPRYAFIVVHHMVNPRFRVNCYLLSFIRTKFVVVMAGWPEVPTTQSRSLAVCQGPCAFCGDPCKVDISEDETTYRQRYWMCSNYAWEPTERQRLSTFIVRNCYYLLIILCRMKSCIFICFVTFVADPFALWFWAVGRHWDQGVRQAASTRLEGVRCGMFRDIGEETQRGGNRKGVQGRGGKEACCCV